MYSDVIELRATKFHIHSDDPAFAVRRRGASRFLMSGEVAQRPASQLTVATPSADLDLALATHSKPEHAVQQLRRALPRDVLLTTHPTAEGLEVLMNEAMVPAARAPRLRIVSTDLVQHVIQLDENKIEFEGSISDAALLTIFCDGRRVTISAEAGLSASATALRVGSSMPHGYRALVDGTTVSVWKDADFFEMVA